MVLEQMADQGPVLDGDYLTSLFRELKEVEIYAEVKRRLKAGEPVQSILAACQAGMTAIGERYQKGQYYITGLVMGSEIMRGVFRMISPHIKAVPAESKQRGTIVLGTIVGDVHDIGKNMFASSMNFLGYEIVDLGVDVPPAKFQQVVMEQKPDIVAISVTLTSCFRDAQVAVNLIRDWRLSAKLDRPTIMIAGCSMDREIASKIGADHWLMDIMNGMALCREIIESAAE